MYRTALSSALVGGLLAVSFYATPAQAQATRTWVSGVGDDVNPCSRTAPCKTFAGAISKTATGGEISVLDPGGFGAVTITKGMTLNGDGTLAGILNAGGVNGIIVNAPATDKVIIRNISLNGAGTGLNGIRIIGGAEVTVDKCTIQGVTANGIEVASTSANTKVYVYDTHITKAAVGIKVSPSSGNVFVTAENVHIGGMTNNGVESASSNTFISINRSNISGSAASGVVVSSGNGRIDVDDTLLHNNATALNSFAGGSQITASANRMYSNAVGFNTGSGAIISGADNKTFGNGGGGPTNTSLGNQ